MRSGVLMAVGLCLATPSLGQFIQYTPPGGVQQLEESSIREELEEAIKESRWRLGKLFLDPWIQLKDVGYDDNIGNRPDGQPQFSDSTATLGLGLRGYVPIGSRGTLAVHVLPEYVWWTELSERRRFNGRYGIGLFTGGSRFNIGLSATRADDTRFFSRQFEDRVNTTDERGSLTIDFALGNGFALFSSASIVRLGFEGQDENAPDLRQSDREERVARLGLRRKLGNGWSIGAGMESSDVEFANVDSRRTNTNEAPFVNIVVDRETLTGHVFVAARDVRFVDPTLRFEERAGSYFVAWRPRGNLELQAFGSSNLVYSFDEVYAFLEDTANGFGFRWKIIPRLSARFFAESGSNDYTAFEPLTARRIDDFDVVGGTFEIEIGRVTAFIGASTTEYVSTVPVFDRTVEVITLTMTVGSTSTSPWS